ncbi:MAG: S9 family peptidase [Gemmatimonadetes bacterium]|nr:S9 family peptidase [Gemmatimonadota bacterium]
MVPFSLVRRRVVGSLVWQAAAVSILVGPGTAVVADRATAQEAGDKPALQHDDTYWWNGIGQRLISADGQWVAWVVSPWDESGDPTLRLARADGSISLSTRGQAPVFTRDAGHLVFRIPPVQAVIDSMTLAGDRRADLPGDHLGVIKLVDVTAETTADDMVSFRTEEEIQSFQVPEDGGSWVAYRLAEADDEDEDGDAEEEAGEAAGEEETGEVEEEAGEEAGEEEEEEERSAEYEKRHEKEEGTPLVLRNLDSGAETLFEAAASYTVSDGGEALVYVASTDDEGGDGIFVVDPATGDASALMEGEGHYDQVAISEDAGSVAFLSDAEDWEADQPSWTLYRSDGGEPAEAAATVGSDGLGDGWWINPGGGVSFSDDGSRLFFGTSPRPPHEPDEETLDRDEVTLDVWNWRDALLQPMQLVQVNQERERSYLAVVPGEGGRVVQLATPNMPNVNRGADGQGEHFLGTSDVPYRQEISWDGRYADVYSVDARTGERRPIVSRVRGFGGASLSPGGGYAYWWDESARHWMAAALDGSSPTANLTENIPYPMWNVLDDHPQGPPPAGFPQWLEHDAGMIAYDRYDAWRVDPRASAAPVRLTEGRDAMVRYRAVDLSNDDEPGLADGEVVFSVFDHVSRESGYARGDTRRMTGLDQITPGGAYTYGRPRKAEDADAMIWTRESFVEYPDIWAGNSDFGDGMKLSDANPQQSDFRWGSAEIVGWTSNDGTPLEGILIKPDGFDPSREYPLMVYFYERSSDGLHRYRAPTPGGSSVAFSFYASRGYVVFVPDIPYEIGYPGESALDAVVPGVLSLIDEGYIDRKKIGVQGHSWGGYQIAYMVTKTDLFAAAEAGAPVSNMTSAYGGIRWQSGMSRMFQYERTQSRIGGTLWDERDRYIHNSPLFFADKVRTPVLMLHNDEDGAVPWYQGIEFFVALRRLEKPVFMLNYNGEAHGLRRRANQKDWAIRMQQFFDHYVLGDPAPVWISDGVPAVDKGRDTGLGVKAPAATTSQGG